MKYNEAIYWLNSFQRFGIKLGLERIKYICKKLGNPQSNYQIIHVGGTNGKGSVCHFIQSILTEAGYKTGLYTSPHLQRFTERFIIDNQEISEQEVVSLVEKIKPIIIEMEKKNNSPTYFEIVTAMCFDYFREKNVDFAVIEVGLGGRFDATNIVEPILSIITNVSLEHQNILGEKINDIAFEKAGIIKEEIPIVTAATGESLDVIIQKAEENNANLRILDEEQWKRINSDIFGQTFIVKGLLKDYSVHTKMTGEFQGENISLAILGLEVLQINGMFIAEKNIINGIEKTYHPGRMEIVNRNPTILLDGAHNIHGINALVNVLKTDFKYEKLIFIFGVLSDKNIEEMLSKLIPIVDVFICTKSRNNRAYNPNKINEILKKLGFNNQFLVKEKINDSVKHAISISGKDDMICVTGSLFTVGEARDFFKI